MQKLRRNSLFLKQNQHPNDLLAGIAFPEAIAPNVLWTLYGIKIFNRWLPARLIITEN